MKTKKITLATVKSFIKKNNGKLFINVKSSFDGMIDGCRSQYNGFLKAETDAKMVDCTLGIQGAWFVGDSRDWFKPYQDDMFTGIEVSNSCGRFIIAVTQ
jgi:hypothetical protein